MASLGEIEDRLLEIERHLEVYARSPNPQRPLARAVTELLEVVRTVAREAMPHAQ